VKIDVYDPAMCCSTGVCGPSVDPALASFAADLEWLAQHGTEVRRYNLGQEPGAFATNDAVRALLEAKGETALPAVFTEGQLRSAGRYPSRDELAGWAGTSAPVVSTELITELAAIGAAIGANCEPCFTFHYAAARKLGLTNAELSVAVKTAQTVKAVPAATVLETAARLLHVEPADLGGLAPTASGSADADADADGGAGSACCGSDTPAGDADSTDATVGSACCGSDTAEWGKVLIDVQSVAPSSGCC
jgi:AhpD family alkylhydroperoxidase